MTKRLQNRISESRMALPVMAVYGSMVWMAGGLVTGHWWIQFALFALSTYLMVELNNSNALIRIYSRMVSCSYIAITTAACFMFGSQSGAFTQLCFVVACLCLFKTYQAHKATGMAFMASLSLSLVSLTSVPVLYFFPVMWGIMAAFLQSLSLRTWGASVLGGLTPYWMLMPYLVYTGSFDMVAGNLGQLLAFAPIGDFSAINRQQWVTLAFVCALALTGTVHYLRTSYNDKIRIRQLYECFITVDFFAFLLFALQPQHYELAMHLLIINTSPLIAHFIALTHTRVTNVSFIAILTATLALTAYNLWISSLAF